MWMAMDPYEGDSEEFETENEAIDWAKERIEFYLDGDGWNEGVDQVCVCKVLHRATQVNIRHREDIEFDEDGCDENGTPWSPEWDYLCEYKLQPLSEIQ